MDWEDVEKLASVMDDHGLAELEFEDEKIRIHLKKPSAVVATGVSYAPAMAPAMAPPAAAGGASAPAAAQAEAPPSGKRVTCPFVGTFYRSPSPDDPPFVEVGQTVRKGQPLCIIEAMKLMNEIEADIDGKVVSILVENAETVEFGQSLFVIDPS